MSRATFLILWTASLFIHSVHSLRDGNNETDTYSGVRVSMSPRSFALAELHDQHGVRPQEDSAVLQARSDIADGEWGGIRAQAKIREYVDGKQKFEQDALRLDTEMHEQYNALLGPGEVKADEAASATGLLSIEEIGNPASEDQQFDNLEKQTQHIMEWFQQLKQLRQTRDKLRSQSQAAVKAASDAGMSQADLKKVQTPLESSKSTAKDKSDKKASALLEKREHLAKVMASSAIEMAQLEKAAGDVTKSLDAYKSWKARDNGSAESQAEAVNVKAKLDAAMEFLSEHENTIDKRRNQIDEMTRDAQLEHNHAKQTKYAAQMTNASAVGKKANTGCWCEDCDWCKDDMCDC